MNIGRVFVIFYLRNCMQDGKLEIREETAGNLYVNGRIILKGLWMRIIWLKVGASGVVR
jgi:hypothetical protein